MTYLCYSLQSLWFTSRLLKACFWFFDQSFYPCELQVQVAPICDLLLAWRYLRRRLDNNFFPQKKSSSPQRHGLVAFVSMTWEVCRRTSCTPSRTLNHVGKVKGQRPAEELLSFCPPGWGLSGKLTFCPHRNGRVTQLRTHGFSFISGKVPTPPTD